MSSDIISITCKILVNTSDISDIRGLIYQGEESDPLSGKYVVRVFSKTPFIDIICNDLAEAKTMYKNILKSRDIVDINEMRFGRWRNLA